MKKKLVLFIGIILFAFQTKVYAQAFSESDSLTTYSYSLSGYLGDQYFKKADSILYGGNLQNAIPYLEKALHHYEGYYGQGTQENSKVYLAIAELLANYGYTAKAADYCQKGLVLLEAQPILNHYLIGDMYAHIAHIYEYHQLSDIALNYYEKALDSFKKSKAIEASYQSVHIQVLLGNTYYIQKDYGMSAHYYKEASLTIEKAVDSDKRPEIALLYEKVGSSLTKTGSFRLAINNLKNAIRINKSIFGEYSLETGKSYQILAQIYYEKESYDSTHIYAEKAVECAGMIDHHEIYKEYLYKITTQFFHKKVYDYAALWQEKLLVFLSEDNSEIETIQGIAIQAERFAERFTLIGRENLSIPFYQLALQLNERIYSDNNLKSAELKGILSKSYLESGEFDTALQYLLQVQASHMNLLDSTHEQHAVDMIDIGGIYWKMNSLDSAQYCFEKVLQYEKGRNTRWKAIALNNLAFLHYENQAFSSALEYAEKLWDFYKENYAHDYIKAQGAKVMMANIEFALYRQERALELYMETYRFNPEIFQKPNDMMLIANNNIASIYRQNNKKEIALRFEQQAALIKSILGEKN